MHPGFSLVRWLLPVILLFCNLLVGAQTDVKQSCEAIVAKHRMLIALADAASDTSYTQAQQEEFTTLGLQLMHDQHDATEALQYQLSGSIAQLETFVRTLSDHPDFWNVDRLAFLEMSEWLEAAHRPSAVRDQLKRDIAAMYAIRKQYAEELSGIFGAVPTRAVTVQRKRWDEYLDMVRSNYQPLQLLQQFDDRTGHDHDHGRTRGGSKSLFGYELPPKTLVLTFDDGPHGTYTAQILDLLNQRRIPAIFFQVGENIGRPQQAGAGKHLPTPASQHSVSIAEDAAHWLGNHSTSHQLLSKLDSAEMVKEIDDCYAALRDVTGDQTLLFRPPYGGLSSAVRHTLEAKGTQPYLWNIDSRDWADPIPESIASRVVTEARKQGRGVILLHDIHKKTVEALPLMLDTLIEDGFRFVLWDGKKVVDPAAETYAARSADDAIQKTNNSLYNNQWALVVGINSYTSWPTLEYAVNDAKGVRDVLIDDLGFAPDHVITLLDEEATRDNIFQQLEVLFDPGKVKEGDAVFVFFAGHGTTRQLPGNRNKGYIIPVDANLTNYAASSISMSEIQDFNDLLPARHVLWVMDACYSGLALTRGITAGSSQRYIEQVTARRARQVLTAGGADEQVADGGPNGHSIFTWTLINGLSGDADLNGDNFITASELFNYVPPLVSSMSQQTPAYGSFVGSAGGDFVFALEAETEQLSDLSEQHTEEDLELKLEVERLRQELATMQAEINRAAQQRSEGEELTVAEQVDVLNNTGLEFYRQQKYAEARAKFQEAVTLDPEDVQSINNLGFIYYKEGNYAKAIVWIEKSLQLSPGRGVAYLNLADAQLANGQKAEAIGNYEKYLGMMKPTDFTAQLEEKVNALKKEVKRDK